MHYLLFCLISTLVNLDCYNKNNINGVLKQHTIIPHSSEDGGWGVMGVWHPRSKSKQGSLHSEVSFLGS